MAQNQVQRKSQIICSLAMGKSLGELIFEMIYEHEEPCEVRVSSMVPWEDGGEILLRDPIKCNA